MVSIIMPVYNERATVVEAINQLVAVDCDKEIIVVDNGSTDGSLELVSSLGYKDLRVFLELKKGKANALRKGIEYSTGEYIIFHDADLEYSVASIPVIVTLLGQYDVVIARRVCPPYEIAVMPFIANKILLSLVRMRYGARLSDIFSGQRGFRRKVLLEMGIDSEYFEVETELTCKMLAGGYSFTECDVIYHPRTVGKKIGFVDFLKILKTFAMPYRHATVMVRS